MERLIRDVRAVVVPAATDAIRLFFEPVVLVGRWVRDGQRSSALTSRRSAFHVRPVFAAALICAITTLLSALLATSLLDGMYRAERSAGLPHSTHEVPRPADASVDVSSDPTVLGSTDVTHGIAVRISDALGPQQLREDVHISFNAGRVVTLHVSRDQPYDDAVVHLPRRGRYRWNAHAIGTSISGDRVLLEHARGEGVIVVDDRSEFSIRTFSDGNTRIELLAVDSHLH